MKSSLTLLILLIVQIHRGKRHLGASIKSGIVSILYSVRISIVLDSKAFYSPSSVCPSPYTLVTPTSFSPYCYRLNDESVLENQTAAMDTCRTQRAQLVWFQSIDELQLQVVPALLAHGLTRGSTRCSLSFHCQNPLLELKFFRFLDQCHVRVEHPSVAVVVDQQQVAHQHRSDNAHTIRNSLSWPVALRLVRSIAPWPSNNKFSSGAILDAV